MTPLTFWMQVRILPWALTNGPEILQHADCDDEGFIWDRSAFAWVWKDFRVQFNGTVAG